MILHHLSLTNFKNIAEASLDFSPRVNCLLGNNGMGKSNLIDAIYTLSFTKSFTGVVDSMLIRRGERFMMARGEYSRREADETLTLGIEQGKRKSLRRGGKEYKRMAEHIGKFPIVMVAPNDIDIIRGSGEERRRWIDMVISQSDSRYLDSLIRYGRALEQRNKMLREGIVDHTLYEAIELPMAAAADYITRARARWLDEVQEILSRYYRAIAGEDELVGLDYESVLRQSRGSLIDLLDSCRRHDEIVKHTSVGPHRDDVAFTLEGMPLRRTGSQGQCKTFAIALRLAQYEFLQRAVDVKPLLLLDDIFDKLDATRVERIMQLVAGEEGVGFGQIFITDTNRKHLDEIVERIGGDHRTWGVDSGSFQLLK